MNMKKRYIGITLIFSKKVIGYYKAIQSSYIIEIESFSKLKEDINSIANSLLKSDFRDYNFVGVSDLFITDNEGEAKFLGRTSYFDDNNIEKARKHILNKKELKEALNRIAGYKRSNLGFVYFHEDKEGKEYYSTIIIYTLLESKKDLNYILSMGECNSLKQAICDFSIEQLYVESLKFVGISDLYPIQNKGLFEQIGEFENLNEIKEEVFGENDLKTKFDEILEDYQSVSI